MSKNSATDTALETVKSVSSKQLHFRNFKQFCKEYNK